MDVEKKRNTNGDGSVRQLPDGKYECIIQSKLINPKTGRNKRIKRIGKTEEESREKAKMALAVWEKGIIQGQDVKIRKTKTFGQYMDEFVETEVKANLTGSGYMSYISSLKNNFYNFPISKYQLQMLNAKEFENYYNTIHSLKSEKTCSLPIQLCRRCCDWLVNKGLLKENYASQVSYKREIVDEYDKRREESEKARKKIFSPEDIQKFYYAYKNNMGEYPVVILFLLETAMRAGEFAALRTDNIDLEKNRIDIVETRSKRFVNNDKNKGIETYTKVPKNKEARFVMMSPLCRECVLYMIEQTKLKCPNNPDNLLYPSFRTGKMRSNTSMEVCFKDLCDKLGIDRDVRLTKTGQKKGLCLHSLRHTADTIANTATGANIVNTALMMGHKAIKTENIYTHATEEALSKVTTPSQAILDQYKKKNDFDEAEYKAYLKLKEKFENQE